MKGTYKVGKRKNQPIRLKKMIAKSSGSNRYKWFLISVNTYLGILHSGNLIGDEIKLATL